MKIILCYASYFLVIHCSFWLSIAELEVAKPDAGDKEAIEETKPVDKSEGGASEAKIETTKSS